MKRKNTRITMRDKTRTRAKALLNESHVFLHSHFPEFIQGGILNPGLIINIAKKNTAYVKISEGGND